LTDINSTGIEFSGNFYPEKLLKAPFFISKVGINYAYGELHKGTNNVFSYYVLDNLKHKLDLEIAHKIWKNLKASWRTSYQDRNGMRTTTEAYQPFWLVNARIMWRTPHTEIYLLASNLFDTQYFDFGVIEQPGRWISLGVSHRLKL
jgi:iron complex outermembrane receptor protein